MAKERKFEIDRAREREMSESKILSDSRRSSLFGCSPHLRTVSGNFCHSFVQRERESEEEAGRRLQIGEKIGEKNDRGNRPYQEERSIVKMENFSL